MPMLPVLTHPGKRGLSLAPAEQAGSLCPAQTPQAVRRPVRVAPTAGAVVRGGCKKGSGGTRGRMARRCTHTGTGEKNCVCYREGCGRASGQAVHLVRHQRRRTGAGPVVCPHAGCGFLCPGLSDLERHLRVHTRERPFVCPREGCGRSFTQSIHLRTHLQVHSEENPFICPVEGCGRLFARQGYLKKHLDTHSGKRPFICPYEGCGSAFGQSSNLKVHLRVHSGEKPFFCPCEGCNYAGAQLASLKQHLAHHCGEKPFVCPHEGCGRAFVAPARLRQHLRRHSGKNTFVGWHRGSTNLSMPPGSGPHPIGRRSAGRPRCLATGKTGLPLIQEPLFCRAAAPLSGVPASAGPAADLACQSPRLGSDSFCSTTTAASGEHQVRARRASPDAEGQPGPGLPPSPLLQDVDFAELQSVSLTDFDMADWLSGDVDASCGWPPGTGAVDTDAAWLACAADDQAFWRALLSPGDTQTSRSTS